MPLIEMDYSGLNFEPHISAVMSSIPRALGLGIEHLRAVAVDKTPEDTGHLRSMAFVQIFELEAWLTFPGPYARYQHYELQLRHRIGQALYLEQPMVQEAHTTIGIMSDVISEAGFE